MDEIAQLIGNPWLALAFLTVGAVLALIARSFLSKYVGERAVHIAEGIHFEERLKRTFADESAKSAAARLDVARAEAAMRILGLMSEIEALLFNWKLTAFFHRDELTEDQTIEDLGVVDLKKASQLTIVLIKTANEGSVLLGDGTLQMVLQWVRKVHAVMFDFHAAYTTSKQFHKDKPPLDNERVKTISQLTESSIYPQFDEIGALRASIRQFLREAARVAAPEATQSSRRDEAQ